ncbi:MAG: M23 family metallopeptidase [Candidatus Thermoplasmatota archaeon]|nr:M23 family metallopeptidase [Candidatus Thermoplasmatota archaeon]
MLEIIKECNPDGCIPIPDCEFDEFMFKDIPYPQDDPNYVAAQPDPDYDFFTWTLPTGASDLRLSLMADIDDFLFDEYGGIGGWGKHDGEHTEGLGHTWIELKSGTPVKSLADGKVKSVQLSGTEYHITIHYGHGLVGGHGEIMTPYVETGDVVKRGQEIGIGMSFQSGQSSAEYSLTDLNRTDGSRSRYGGSGVSVFDYLEEEDKKLIVNKYKEEVIESFLRDGTTVWGFNPVEPYLTNKLFHHDDNPGTILGTWYLISEPWGTEYPSDIMAFIEADNPFYTGTLANSQDDQGDGDWNFEGEYEVDYSVTPNKLKIIQPVSTDFYAIFEVIEDNGASYGFEPERATMKIQFSEVNYPSTFSDDAYVYIQRTQYPRREDGIEPAPGG